MFAGPVLLEMTSKPEYCNTCHVMEEEFESWFLTGKHRNIKCIDCHLPNSDPLNHIVWKGIDGLKDLLYFHLNIYDLPIIISTHGKTTVQKNCVRCHNSMVSVINTDIRNCWDCHRRTNHKTVNFAYINDSVKR